jgi:hypothetical protein
MPCGRFSSYSAGIWERKHDPETPSGRRCVGIHRAGAVVVGDVMLLPTSRLISITIDPTFFFPS